MASPTVASGDEKADENNPNDIDIGVGKTFYNFAEFEELLNRRNKALGEIWVKTMGSRTVENANVKISDSSKHFRKDFQYAHMSVVCKYGGIFKSRGSIRHVWSNRIGCPARIMISARRKLDHMFIKECNLEHNHVLCDFDNPEEWQSMTLDDEEIVRTLINDGATLIRIQEHLLKTIDKKVPPKSIYRLRMRMREEQQQLVEFDDDMRPTNLAPVADLDVGNSTRSNLLSVEQSIVEDLDATNENCEDWSAETTETGATIQGTADQQATLSSNVNTENLLLSSWHKYYKQVKGKGRSVFYRPEDDKFVFSILLDMVKDQRHDLYTKCGFLKNKFSQLDMLVLSIEQMCLQDLIRSYENFKSSSMFQQPKGKQITLSAADSLQPVATTKAHSQSTTLQHRATPTQTRKSECKSVQQPSSSGFKSKNSTKSLTPSNTPQTKKKRGRPRKYLPEPDDKKTSDNVKLKSARVVLDRIAVPSDGSYIIGEGQSSETSSQDQSHVTEGEGQASESSSQSQELGRGRRKKIPKVKYGFVEDFELSPVKTPKREKAAQEIVFRSSPKRRKVDRKFSDLEGEIVIDDATEDLIEEMGHEDEQMISLDRIKIEDRLDFPGDNDDSDGDVEDNDSSSKQTKEDRRALNSGASANNNAGADTNQDNCVAEPQDQTSAADDVVPNGETNSSLTGNNAGKITGVVSPTATVSEAVGSDVKPQADVKTEVKKRKHERFSFKCDKLAPIICSKCQGRFRAPGDLVRHWREKHGLQDGKQTENIYMCDCCDKTFSSIYQVRLHYRQHTGALPHPCPKCDQSFTTYALLRKHLPLHRQQEKVVLCCRICVKTFFTQRGFDAHMNRHTEQEREIHESMSATDIGQDFSAFGVTEEDAVMKREADNPSEWLGGLMYKSETDNLSGKRKAKERLDFECDKLAPMLCSLCKTRFLTAPELCSHFREAHKDVLGTMPSRKLPYFACDLCSYTFLDTQQLKMHYRIHTNSRPHKCEICTRSFRTFKGLEGHLQTHRTIKPFPCSLCPKQFVSKQRLVEHERRHNKNRERPYICEVCGKDFCLPGQLRNHKITHSTERPHKCNICGVTYAHKSILNIHMRLHSSEFRHECDICGRKFNTRGHMVTHRRRHTGEKPYKCGDCDYAAVSQSQLRQHQFKHSTDKPFACRVEHCKSKFKKQSHLISHHKTQHPGVKPYTCSTCGESFTLISSLKRHTISTECRMDKTLCEVQLGETKLATPFTEVEDKPYFLMNSAGEKTEVIAPEEKEVGEGTMETIVIDAGALEPKKEEIGLFTEGTVLSLGAVGQDEVVEENSIVIQIVSEPGTDISEFQLTPEVMEEIMKQINN